MDVIDGGFVYYDISLLDTSFSSHLSSLRQLATLKIVFQKLLLSTLV